MTILFFRLAKLWDAVWKDNQIYPSNSKMVHATLSCYQLQEFCFVLMKIKLTNVIRKSGK